MHRPLDEFGMRLEKHDGSVQRQTRAKRLGGEDYTILNRANFDPSTRQVGNCTYLQGRKQTQRHSQS
jgi:hypothetical protein